LGPQEAWLDELGMLVDFGVIKRYFKEGWDHRLILPEQDEEVYPELGYPIPTRPLFLKYTTCEHMAFTIQNHLAVEIMRNIRSKYKPHLDHIEIHFELWEGPHQAVII